MVHPDDYEAIDFDCVDRYISGGLPAVNIGDSFQDGRYKILNMLGYGAYSNVWLARDNRNDCNVSIKTVAANNSSDNRELEILQRIEADSDTQHQGRKHLPRLLDHFYHDGPNGRSLFLVLGRLGPSLWYMLQEGLAKFRLDIRLSRRISRQLLSATDYLHSCGIVHGDIHANNVLFCIPTTKQLGSDSKPPRAYEVCRKDGGPLEQGVPKYYVDSMKYSENDCDDLIEVQLIDFSNAFFVSDPPASADTISTQLAPEMLFKKPLSKALDIWGLACTTYQLATSKELFILGLWDNRSLVTQFYDIIGESSAHWLFIHLANAVHDGVWKDWPDAEYFFITHEDNFEEVMLDNFARKNDDPHVCEVAKEEFKILNRYLRKMLIVDPRERPSTKELLEDEWVQ